MGVRDKSSLKFSDGICYLLKRRWVLRIFISDIESCDCDDAAVLLPLPHVQETFRGFILRDKCNSEEFGFNYRIEPDTNIVSQPMPGRTKNKELISVLAFENTYGAKKYDLLINGSS